MINFDKNYIKNQNMVLAGIDEAGRGPLAGPVVCAMAIMPLDDAIEGVNDSKKLTPKKRESLYNLIIEKALSYSVAIIDQDIIDDINILNATKKGMEQCILTSPITPDIILIDAVKGINTDIQNIPIIKGDTLSYNIACASIIAKVTRDHLMEQYALDYPQYNFDKHKGYGTKQHIEALKLYGACPLHRNTFIKNFGIKK